MRELNISKENEEIENQVKKKSPETLLQHIEQVIELAEKSKLSDEFYQKAKTSANFVAKTMNLTCSQAIIFSIFIEHSNDYRVQMNDFSRFLDCRNVKTISMMSDIDELENRRLVRCCREKGGEKNYRVPFEVVNAVKQNIVYKPENTKNLSTSELFNHIERLFEERSNNEISYNALIDELRSLFNDNLSLVFCRQMKEYEKMCGNKEENFLLLSFFCHSFVNEEDDNIVCRDFEFLYDRKRGFKNTKTALQNGENELIINNIIEYVHDDGFSDKENFSISEAAKEKLFAELNIKDKQAENKKGLVLHKDISPKELFYNEKEQKQMAQLSSLLDRENFVSVQKKLEKNGMRKGFACLFYGAPGTGKTETVYQIARSTGRDIFSVDISQTKSCFFGESEKKIKGIFEKYRSFVKSCQTVPILLFNEADAVIGKRKDVATGPVSQTENAIQNIILQEMENLEGIMIATTNLTENLDKAFERRFLYKIEFEKPTVEAKEKIWQTMLPALSEKERQELANAYSFSGGQIENITRKYTIDCILNGTEPSIETIRGYCETEFLYKNDERKKIGFRV